MKSIFLLVCLCLASTLTLQAQYNLTVAKDGSGNYTTVQAAIDAAPTNGTSAYTIFIKNGTYKEKITVASNKTFITLIGESVANVILTYDDYSGKPMPGGGTFGTSNSASTTINATDFTAINITFENTTGESPQALAINVNNDRCAFKNCRFLGGQDTLLANNAGKKQYYKQCYIDGTVDFIFGNATAVFDDCTIYPKTRESGTGNSYITAANTPSGQTYGYVFRNCTINMNRGVTQYFLGRPWQNSTGSAVPFSENKVVFLNTTMSGSVVNSLGWSIWDAGTQTNLITFAEYQSVTTSGTAVDVSSRVAWSKQLTAGEAAVYTNANLFGVWDPCAAFTNLCTTNAADIAVSNFRGVKGASVSTFTWNASWGIDQVVYTLYRSVDNKVSYQSLYTVNGSGVFDVNFGTTDPVPPAGNTYYYYVVASKAGLASHTTAIVPISSTPTITVGTLGSFVQGLGTPSGSQSYALSAVNLLGDLTITPPANYQISLDNGVTWSTTPRSITPTSGTITSRFVSVRLNATATGTFSGNILHTSSGAVDANVTVTGTVQAAPLETIVNLLYFPMTVSNAVDVATQATGVATSSPMFSRLVASNGTTVSAVPAYSTTYGQAFGADATGTWTTTVGGPGGNLSRGHYEEFTVTANAGYTVRVDSLTLNSSFYNTASNTRLAVWYSKTAFTTADSASFTGGILGADGTAIVNNPNGTFTTAIGITNQTAATSIDYRLALNSSTGVTLTAGQTLTVRLYFSCGSGSAGRYGKIKEVYFRGITSTTIPLSMIAFNAEKLSNNTNRIKWTTADEQNVSRFEIERSSDAQQFEYVGTTKAIGNTKTQHNYDFIDAQPVVGLNYYRLKMIDLDGSFTYTKVVVVDNQNAKGLKSKVFPNPFTDALTVVLENGQKTGNVSITLTDVLGHTLYVQKISSFDNKKIDISTVDLASGAYFLKISDGHNTTIHKVLK